MYIGVPCILTGLDTGPSPNIFEARTFTVMPFEEEQWDDKISKRYSQIFPLQFIARIIFTKHLLPEEESEKVMV